MKLSYAKCLVAAIVMCGATAVTAEEVRIQPASLETQQVVTQDAAPLGYQDMFDIALDRNQDVLKGSVPIDVVVEVVEANSIILGAIAFDMTILNAETGDVLEEKRRVDVQILGASKASDSQMTDFLTEVLRAELIG